MDYFNFMNSIKETREFKRFKYSELHHIIPRCRGGNDSEENLVYLKYKEHFIAHRMLLEVYSDDRNLITAFHLMCGLKRYHCTPEDYEYARRIFVDSQTGNKYFEGKEHSAEWKASCSKWMTGRKQVLGRVWIHNNEDSRMINPEFVDEYLEAGWVLGRGSVHGKETRELIRKISSSRIWINNGKDCTMIDSDAEVPEGYRRGRLLSRDNLGRILESDG